MPSRICSDFPTDQEQAACLISYLGIGRVLSLSPARQLPSPLNVEHEHMSIPNHSREALLLALPSTCQYIQTSIDSGKPVLVHCMTESHAAVVVCAYCE